MPWNKLFISAAISTINESAYQLRITWSWYSVYEYDETFLFHTLDAAKSKFLEIRSRGQLHLYDDSGKPLKI